MPSPPNEECDDAAAEEDQPPADDVKVPIIPHVMPDRMHAQKA